MSDPTVTQTAPPRQLVPLDRGAARLVAYLPDGRVRVGLIGGPLYVGRKGTNGLATGDKRMSGIHFRCRLRRDTGEVALEDQDSRNGTAVNGRFTREAVLHDGDVIRAGDTVFVYERGVAGVVADPGPDLSQRGALLARELSDASVLGGTILLTGETGAGKGYAAERLADQMRPGAPFVAVNCAAIPRELFESELFGHAKGSFSGAAVAKEGLIESARGGVVFLDEVGELSTEVQAKLLRVIETGLVRRVGQTQERRVNVAWIAATNVDPEAELRDDLYHRLAATHIEVPPLRTRRVDVIPLLRDRGVVGDHSAFTAEALEALLSYRWPGNVRELMALGGRLARLPRPIDYHQLPAALVSFLVERARPAPSKSAAPPRAELEAALAAAGGNVSALARTLGQHRTQVMRWLKGYGLK